MFEQLPKYIVNDTISKIYSVGNFIYDVLWRL